MITIILLLGVFFTSSIQSVHRWYKIPVIGINVQPSEYAKLVIVLTLAAFLDKKKDDMKNLSSSLYALLIAVIPFLLILKQPDLGTALVIYPISLALCFFVDMNKNIIRIMYLGALCAAIFVFLFFSQIVSHEKMQPFFTKFL